MNKNGSVYFWGATRQWRQSGNSLDDEKT